ncbi:MAG: Na(+)/H(+) antiporter subunit B [Solirubrobacteraceae bacterium]
MTVLQTAVLILVVASGTAVVLVSDPLRQALVLSILGLALALLFFVFQAPDVALSQIVVSAVGLPIIILAALRKIGRQGARRERDGGEGE